MKLKCRINEIDYDIVAGATFSEEYNETLDSGSIILDHIGKIESLKPFDDVYIWNSDEEFNGYYNVGDKLFADFFGGSISLNVTVDPGVENWQTIILGINVVLKDNGFYPRGGVMDIWSSIFVGGIGDTRYRVSKIPLKFTLRNPSDLSEQVGYYKIPMSPEGNIVDDIYLRLEKDSDYTQSADLPDFILVPFKAEVSKLDGAYGWPLFIGNFATSPADEMSWDIIKIEPVSESSYSYQINNSATNTVVFEIRGMTDEEVLSLKNIRLSFIAGGNRYDFALSQIASVSPSSQMVFLFTPVGSGTLLWFNNVVKVEDGLWRQEVSNLRIGPTNQVLVNGIMNNPTDGAYIISQQKSELPKFFKHMLVDSFTCDMVDLEHIHYKYKIDLMSETKRLEKKILPNISITQPIVGEKRSIWYYLNQYIELYSPKIKVIAEDGKWEYRSKYMIDQRNPGDYDGIETQIKVPVHEIFDDSVFAPEMSLSAPNLREILSRLMIVKDCIPVVKNDVIYAMRISDTHGAFVTDSSRFSFISESMSSGNYSTAFRREYGGAISQKNSTHMVEYLGFRNSGSALMTLDNMRLETRFPIYKINKLYMCYYKAFNIYNTETDQHYKKLVLVKQDISKLVLQNSVRDALPADWTKLPSGSWDGISPDEMSKYRLLTLGYDIGSNQITGWGEKYSYIADLLGWTRETDTYIETIMTMIDNKYNQYGIGYLQFLDAGEELEGGTYTWQASMVTPNNSSNTTDKLKSLFFEMDYIGMYSGAIIHSKENTEEDDIETSDNCSTSLSILEADGLFEREKANRLANPDIGFIARFKSVDEMNITYNDILGAVWGDDVVIHHREYQIFEDCVVANFGGSKDYVMKNYFTSVFAKYRTYSYASYGESVNRTENDRYLVVLSNDSCFYESEIASSGLLNISSVLSAFSQTAIDESTLQPIFPNQINVGYFSFSDGDYFSDVTNFVSGYSLCFNIKTFGSITSGNYISQLNCYDDGKIIPFPENNPTNSYVGSAQAWYKMPVSESDGFLKTIGCFFGHFDDADIPESINNWIETDQSVANLYKILFEMPKKQRTPTFYFGKDYDFCKDDKEIIDFTLQYELVNQDETVLASEWLMKLTDFNDYVKLPYVTKVPDKKTGLSSCVVYFASEYAGWNFNYLFFNGGFTYRRIIKLEVRDNIQIETGNYFVNCVNETPYSISYSTEQGGERVNVFIQLDEIVGINRDSNDDVQSLEIRAVFRAKNGVSGMETQGTATLTFNAITPINQGWLAFEYKGQDCPARGADIGDTIKNNKTEQDPETVNGSIALNDDTFDFPKTMYIIRSTEPIEKALVYSQYTLINLPAHMNIVPVSDNLSFQDVFAIEQDEYGRPFIKIGCESALQDGDKSLQYWYYDANGDKYLHFVFGINRTKAEGDAKAYISVLKSRSRKVYNAMHRATANTVNCAESGNEGDYGEQLYEETAED